MNTRKKGHTAQRRLMQSAAVSALVAMGAFTANAQETVDPVEEDAVQSTIVVTGSRIPQDPNAVSPVPVQSVSDEDFQLSGEINLADVVNDVPALVSSETAENSDDGSNALNLRGMGTNRTLTLVNGRRHVAGFEGDQAVDVGSIPSSLVERVEVLTGGASAVYGSDAVTGVVNFILKDDFEGFELDLSTGMSGEADAEYLNVKLLAGKNFDNERGNLTFAFDFVDDSDLRMGDRDWAANNGRARGQANPALRFQKGDITGSMPNFSQYYNFDTRGGYPFGGLIPSAEDFISAYEDAFGTTPTLTSEELALINRAATAPSRAILPFPTFSISSNRGVISPGDFGLANLDVDGNGVDDCLDSFVGYNNSLVGSDSFGLAGGCWVVNDDGSVRPYQDGLVAGNFNGFGGDGIQDDFNEDFLYPETDTYSMNLLGSYELIPGHTLFGEAKYVNAKSTFGGPLNTFYDLLYGAPDNPFIPAELQGVAAATGGLFITRDPTDLGDNIDQTERETYRFVGGVRGDLDNGISYEISGNYGEFQRTRIDNNYVLLDRFFAAIDVVADADGNPVCRADLDGSLYPTTIFEIPAFDPGFFTFTPGDGQCVAANIWGGPNSISPEAVDFITTSVVDKLTLKQTVFSATMFGDSREWFALPAGPVGFAAGVEHRREESENQINPFDLGVLPEGTPFEAGQPVQSVSGNNSLGFSADSEFFNSSGAYDVTDIFAEVSVPILADMPFAESLKVNGAFRMADYSTIGQAETWSVGAEWTPISDITFRGTVSQAIRAPNISELFGPASPEFFRPVDPCDVNEIPNAPDPALRAANCLADGLPADYTDPLSARFPGSSGGNPDLQEETADTTTIGFILHPRIVPGLTVTVDYWDVEIEDAISSVSAQDIVDNCYDSTGFPGPFCGLFDRNRDTTSPQFGGFKFLRQTQINFASIEAAGTDFAVNYTFDWAENTFGARLVGSKQEKLDFFTDPSDPTLTDPELGEIQQPEWAGNISLTWERGPALLGLQTTYVDSQGLTDVEIETADNVYGPAGFTDEMYLFDLFGRYEFSDMLEFYGGVNNVTDEEPFITENAWPVGPRGRFFFLGAKYSY